MVVELAVLQQGFAKLNGGGMGVGEGEGCALDEVLLPSLLPPIYRAKNLLLLIVIFILCIVFRLSIVFTLSRS